MQSWLKQHETLTSITKKNTINRLQRERQTGQAIINWIIIERLLHASNATRYASLKINNDTLHFITKLTPFISYTAFHRFTRVTSNENCLLFRTFLLFECIYFLPDSGWKVNYQCICRKLLFIDLLQTIKFIRTAGRDVRKGKHERHVFYIDLEIGKNTQLPRKYCVGSSPCQ